MLFTYKIFEFFLFLLLKRSDWISTGIRRWKKALFLYGCGNRSGHSRQWCFRGGWVMRWTALFFFFLPVLLKLLYREVVKKISCMEGGIAGFFGGQCVNEWCIFACKDPSIDICYFFYFFWSNTFITKFLFLNNGISILWSKRGGVDLYTNSFILLRFFPLLFLFFFSLVCF